MSGSPFNSKGSSTPGGIESSTIMFDAGKVSMFLTVTL
jgi:hypothetical protein